METLALLGTVIDMGKKIVELAKLSKDATMKMAVAELQLALAELKGKMADVMDENTTLKAELKKATEPPDVKFVDGKYFKIADNDGPFCVSCRDNEGKMIRLKDVRATRGCLYECHICKAEYDRKPFNYTPEHGTTPPKPW